MFSGVSWEICCMENHKKKCAGRYNYHVIYPAAECVCQLSFFFIQQHLSIIASLDRNIALVGKPLVSVKRFVLKLNNETKIIEGFRQVLPNVNDISIEPETNGFLENICENFPHLRRLTIPNSKIEGSTMFQNFRPMRQLEELILPTAYFQPNVMLPIRCLKRLVLTNVDWFFDEDLILLAELYPNLKYLELTRGYRITATGIEAFRSRLPDCVVNILENMYPLF